MLWRARGVAAARRSPNTQFVSFVGLGELGGIIFAMTDAAANIAALS